MEDQETDINKEEFTVLANSYADEWGCVADGDVFFTHSSLLWPVLQGGQKGILKIAKPDDDEAHAAELLQFYNGRGAVKVLSCDGHVQLLERVVSSDDVPTLEEMVLTGKDDEATHIICDVIEQLHAAPYQGASLPNLHPFRSRSDTMREHIKEGRVKDVDLPLFQIAQEMSDELIAETLETQRPLHGDIHHFNIMHSAERGWLAIDPKGILGPRVYEYANSLVNPYMHKDIVAVPDRMERQASIMAERSGLDKQLILGFTFLHGMQCAAWSLYDPDQSYWLACAKTAAHLAGVKTGHEPVVTLG